MSSSVPFTRRQALVVAVVLLVVLALAGRLLARPGPGGDDGLAVEPVAVAAATEQAAETAEPPGTEVVVHVAGAVRSPGLYRLAAGSRVADALVLAGGPVAKADLAAVNLAAPLVDGTQVLVPRRGRSPVAAAPPAGSAPAAPPAPAPVHLNTATAEELQTIPGVGPVTAQRIIEFREQNGPFRSVDELDAVSGIGPKRLEQLRELVTP